MIGEILSLEEIEYFKNNKDQITEELLKLLRSKGDLGKKIALQILDTEQDNEKYYLDAFGNRISYNGDRALKKAFTSMALADIHIKEIENCKNNINHFIDNYVQIMTKKGTNFPELREYQKDFIKILDNPENENIISLQGRQCIRGNTVVTINNKNVTIEELFNSNNIENIEDSKFIASVYPSNSFIKTDVGNIKIKAQHKTIKYDIILIKTKNHYLECAEQHVLIDKNYNEIYAINSLDKDIITETGLEKVLEVKNLNIKENCYDLELEKHHLYFSNGFLSHNSGKSVTVGEYLTYKFNFFKDVTIGICANRASMAREVLDKVRKMFITIPMWMKIGVVTWNKGSLESEKKSRILTDATSGDSFRGFSCNIILIDECVEYNETIILQFNNKNLTIKIGDFYKIYDKNIKYKVKTSNGFKKFDDIKETYSKENIKIYFDNNSIIVTPNHKFYINNSFVYAKDLKINDEILFNNNIEKITKIEKDVSCSNKFYDLINVDAGHHYNASGFEVSNCAFINSNMFNEFMDSVAPSQSALSFKQMIMISTANGRNHFYDFWKDASEDIKTSKNGFVKFEVNWRDVPRFDAKGNKLEPDEFRNITIKKLGSVYFEQNYGNSFIGSSTTLIPGEILGKYNAKDPEFRYQPGLNVFEEVQPQHKYILGVDPAKDGLDYFAVQVLDITNLNFKQVAAAKLQIDYLSMPEILVEWAQRFNNALLVIENNEGAGQSIADTIFRDYEYENMYFDLKKEKDKDKSRKKYPGFRTTKVTRDLLLQTMKVLAQENKLLVQDKETINELWDFKLINGKYQADDGKHDDTVMALALCLVPFINIKNFEDMKEVIKAIKSKDTSEDFDDLIVLGSFDDFIDEETPKNYEYITNS